MGKTAWHGQHAYDVTIGISSQLEYGAYNMSKQMLLRKRQSLSYTIPAFQCRKYHSGVSCPRHSARLVAENGTSRNFWGYPWLRKG